MGGGKTQAGGEGTTVEVLGESLRTAPTGSKREIRTVSGKEGLGEKKARAPILLLKKRRRQREKPASLGKKDFEVQESGPTPLPYKGRRTRNFSTQWGKIPACRKETEVTR